MGYSFDTWLTTKSKQKIFLLRHGEIHGGYGKKRFIGQINLPLNETGHHQADAWRRVLSGVPLTDILSSDLQRCENTAQIIAREQSVSIETLAGLREIDLGKWDGLSFQQVKDKQPEAFKERGVDLALFCPPDGESFLDLQQRVVPLFNQVVQQAGDLILIVTHAGVIRTIVCHILGIPLKNLFYISQDYGAMNLIDFHGDHYRVQALNFPPQT